MALLILAMGIDPASGRRDAAQFCAVLTSALQSCQASKDRCLRNYHVTVTQALATVKASPADALRNAIRLDEYDELYVSGKRIAEGIQSSALNGEGALKATKETDEHCGLLHAGAEL